RRFAELAGAPTRFTGYETERQPTSVAALAVEDADSDATGGNRAGQAEQDGHGEDGLTGQRLLVKLAESPFYAAGGGQISDTGTIECERGDCLARVEGVFRLGDDQALAVVVERGTLQPEEPVLARVDHLARHATQCNHTATHLLHAALRARLGAHVRQAGSYVGPDKLRFDFSHGAALSPEELRDVEDQVNAWIARADPVHPITTTLQEAKRLGAMALFGEKYGEVVRMVEIGDGDYSRELCGGTHVANAAEIGPFRVLSETSSAANVRRIEALTGPAAVALLRAHDRALQDTAATLRASPEQVAALVGEREGQRKQLLKSAREGGVGVAGIDIDALAAGAEKIEGGLLLVSPVTVPDAKALLDVADRIRGKLGRDSAIVLGTVIDGRVSFVASVAPALVQRGLRAGEIVKVAAAVAGGGGGGRDTMAQAGGRDPEKLDEALAAARSAIEAKLASLPSTVD
ncbi:MAG: DHHA1 domain-containing protein, partial [Solirubrobacteraceae bacterium]